MYEDSIREEFTHQSRSFGSGGTAAADLVAQLLQDQPATAKSFSVSESAGGRCLHQRYWLGRWRLSV
jgi:hypothetical protein